MKTIVISAFPGIGKTYAFEKLKKMGYNVLDSDSSKFSWMNKDGKKVRNPEFPINYINHIDDNLGTANFIFVSSHKEVRDALDEVDIDYNIVIPNAYQDKALYLKRYKDRGSSQEFINLIDEHWDEWLTEIKNSGKSYTVLYGGSFLFDYIQKEYLTINIVPSNNNISSLPILKVKRLTPTAKLPTCAHEGDLMDIYADEEITIGPIPTLVSTGLAFDIPRGYQLRIYNRSSNPLKNGLIQSNGVGVIDSGYKDEVKGLFHCCQEEYKDYIDHFKLGMINLIETGYRQKYHTIHKGDKIMQAELVPLQSLRLIEVEELDKSNDRGGGFGSTGD